MRAWGRLRRYLIERLRSRASVLCAATSELVPHADARDPRGRALSQRIGAARLLEDATVSTSVRFERK
jgi:hypothetical protein